MTRPILEILIRSECQFLFFYSPLEDLLDNLPQERRPEFDGNSACWHGYRGTWELRSDQLFLNRLEAMDSASITGMTSFNLQILFPGQQAPIAANWFDGWIFYPEGDLFPDLDLPEDPGPRRSTSCASSRGTSSRSGSRPTKLTTPYGGPFRRTSRRPGTREGDRRLADGNATGPWSTACQVRHRMTFQPARPVSGIELACWPMRSWVLGKSGAQLSVTIAAQIMFCTNEPKST
jgi:hypothetical protein